MRVFACSVVRKARLSGGVRTQSIGGWMAGCGGGAVSKSPALSIHVLNTPFVAWYF